MPCPAEGHYFIATRKKERANVGYRIFLAGGVFKIPSLRERINGPPSLGIDPVDPSTFGR